MCTDRSFQDATDSQRGLCQRDVRCTTKRTHPWVWIVVILEIEGVPSVSSVHLEFVVEEGMLYPWSSC